MEGLTPLAKRAKHVQTSAWTTINPSVSISIDLSDSTLSEPESSEHELEDDGQNSSPAASKHRSAILEVANRLTAARKKPTRKRKVGVETSRTATKKSKRKVQCDTELFSSDSELHFNTDVRPSVQISGTTHEPLKRYLQPTKPSKLNESVGVEVASQTKWSSFIKTDTLNAGNNDSDGGTTGRNGSYFAQTENMENQTPLPTAYTNHPSRIFSAALTEDENFMDTDLDDVFESLPDLTIEDSIPQLSFEQRQHNLFSTPVTMASPGNTADVSNNLSSPVSLTSTAQSTSSQVPSIRPFLRSTFEDPIPTIKYSPIPRLIPILKITTCFRIAEALRILKGSTGSGIAGQRTTVELFAIIVGMSIDYQLNTQTLQFADIFFPDRPPYINGSGRDLTSANIVHSLLEKAKKHKNSVNVQNPEDTESILCRAIISVDSRDSSASPGSTTLSGSPDQLNMRLVHVEALRESNWDEVEYVRGIVDPEGVEAEKEKEKLLQQQM